MHYLLPVIVTLSEDRIDLVVFIALASQCSIPPLTKDATTQWEELIDLEESGQSDMEVMPSTSSEEFQPSSEPESSADDDFER